MTKKTTQKPKKVKELDIKDVLKAVDSRNYNFYDSLTEKQQKEFSPFILMRFTSNVQGDRDIQEWFIERTNEMVNKDHWVLSKNHKELLWKLYAATGAGIPVFHTYLASQKIELDKIETLLGQLYPSMKIEDIKFLSSMMDHDDREELFDKMGFDENQKKLYR